FVLALALLPDLHSFPTRRSSDLEDDVKLGKVGQVPREDFMPAFGGGDRVGSEMIEEGFLDQVPLVGVIFYHEDFHQSPRKVFFRSEEHTSELQSLRHLVCRLLLE